MNKELLQILSMTSGGLLGTLGGYRWKWMRRYLLPVILGLVALLGGFAWWRCLIMSGLLIGAFSLGYGEKVPYWRKALVGISYTLPTLLLGFSWWQVITPALFLGLFALSNWKPASSTLFWKAVEFLVFACVGVTVASLL